MRLWLTIPSLWLAACAVQPAAMVTARDPLPRAESVSCRPLVDDAFAATLAATGCFDGPLPSSDLIPYSVRSPLWTDGALKERWLVVPPGETVGFDSRTAWEFPSGTVLIKRFLAAPGRPIETRFMLWTGRAWRFATYAHDGDAAGLLAEPTWDTVTLASGAEIDWYFPDRAGCATCHALGALGPVAAQLDTAYDYGDGVRSQLDELARVGVFDVDEARADQPLTIPSDPDGPLADRARSWLHANCAHCHRPGGWTPPEMTMDLRAETPLTDARVCGEPVQYDQAPLLGAYRIAPGDVADSALWGRITTEGPSRMPLVGATLVDPVAQETVRAWIAGMVSCDEDG